MATTQFARPMLQHRNSVGDILRSIDVEDELSEKTVLVVDDDNISRTVLSKLLSNLNFKVVAVEGGRQALKLLAEESQQFHLLLVDVLMPDIDGIELLRIFKQAYSQDIPIIMVSSSEDPDTIARCFQSGAEDFLQKPVKLEMLKRRVEMCLDDRKRRRKEALYQEMLKKERENRNKLTLRVEEQQKELEQIKSQITDTIETPMQVVMKTIGDLMEGSYSADQYRGALVAILKSLGSRDLYRPALSSVLNNQSIDSGTLKWLETEYLQQEESAELSTQHHHKQQPNQETQNSTEIHEGVDNATVVIKKTIPDLNSFHFDIFAYPIDEMIINVAYMFQELGLNSEFNLDNTKLLTFLRRIRAQYNKNPYHNFTHALDVTQFVFSCLCLEKANILSPLEKLSAMVAALCHDVDHPGLNNNYLINAKMSLALLYNDVSVLENHHCATTFRTLRESECNFVENLSAEEYKEFRRCVISTILATDMAHHFEILTKFQTRTQTGPLSKESKDDKQQLMNIIMKIADVSNSVRPYPVAAKWADMLIEEFLEQGDKERNMGMQISPLMDRNTLVRARMQINFIDYIAGPLYKTAAQYAPGLTIATDTLATNREIWSAQLEHDEAELKKRQEKMKQQEQPQTTSAAITTTSGDTNTSNSTPPPMSSNDNANNHSAAQQPNNQQNEQKDENTNKEPIYGQLRSSDEITKVRGIRVIFAEDDPVATNIIDNILQKEVGYELFTHSSMEDALEAYESGTFDAALINLEMGSSKQDGWSIAKRIHDINTERSRGKKYSKMIPIVGMISPQSNKQRAEEQAKVAGVTVILQKPIPILLLLNTLEHVLEQALDNAEPVDHDLAIEMIGGEEEFLIEMLDEFIMIGATQREQMQTLIQMKDQLTKEQWDELQLTSHSLKGASAQLGAKPVSQAAFIIEKASKNRDTKPLDAAIELLEKRLADLYSYVTERYHSGK